MVSLQPKGLQIIKVLDYLTNSLAPDGNTRRGRPPRLSFSERVLATVLHQQVALAAEPRDQVLSPGAQV